MKLEERFIRLAPAILSFTWNMSEGHWQKSFDFTEKINK